MNSLDAQWCLNSAAELIIRQWDDEGIVFDGYSGDTHLVDQVAVTILMCLQNQNGVYSQSEVIEFCADSLGYKIDADFNSHVISVLNRLASLNLLSSPCN